MTLAQRLSTLAALVACATPVSTLAATWGYSTTASACYTSSIANATSVQNAGTCKITATGADAAQAGGAELRAYANYGSGSGFSGRWRAASLTNQGGASGYGINNRQSSDAGEGSSPEHAIDNDGFIDAVAYKFDNSTILQQVTIGWSSNDSDFSVLYYDGNGDAFASMQAWGTGAVDFANSGWKLLNHYNVAAQGDTDILVNLNNTTVSSSFWMVTAYSSAFGGSALDTKKDYFKLLSVGGIREPERNETPEPGALALAGLALAGIAVQRRRRNR